jgi:hypothetical protein
LQSERDLKGSPRQDASWRGINLTDHSACGVDQ